MFICTDTEVLILSKYKYPYVPKEYYSAVMFACKLIRENGYFNKAIKTAAKYLSVHGDLLRLKDWNTGEKLPRLRVEEKRLFLTESR